MTTATMKIRARRNAERRARVASEWALVIGAGLLLALLAVGVVAILVAQYNAGM